MVNLISPLTFWWYPCAVISRIGTGNLLWSVCSLDEILLAFALLHFVLQGQTPVILAISWLPTFAFNSSIRKMTFFLMLVLEDIVGLHRPVNLSFFGINCWGHRFGLLWCWMICLGNESRSFFHFCNCTQVLLVFIPIPKKANEKECSNCCTIALISHTSKVMLKFLQARLLQYVNHELADV